MANIKSSKKSIRKIAKRTLRNKAEKSRIKTASKKLQLLKDGGDAEAIKAAAKVLMSVVDKAGKHGVWHKNKVNRVKSRLSPFVFGSVLKKPEDMVAPKPLATANGEAIEAESAVKSKEKKVGAKAGAKKKAVAKRSAPKKLATAKAPAAKAKKSPSKKAE